MLKTKQMPKNTKKKLKKTKIIGGKNIAAFTLREKLEHLIHNSKAALHGNIVELVKSIGKNEQQKYNINNNDDIQRFDIYDTIKYITPSKLFIKYALLCLDDHDNNSYLLLKKKYQSNSPYKNIFDDGTIEKEQEQELEEKAAQYYTLFENFVKNLVENIEKTDTMGKEKTFNDCMYDIYSDGIILLTVKNSDAEYNLKLYKKNGAETEKTELTEIVDFFKEKRNSLIIKKYMNDTSNDNYLYDCMLQIINKLARTLLEKLDDSTLDKTGTFSKDALENAVEEEEADQQAVEAAAEEGDGAAEAAEAPQAKSEEKSLINKKSSNKAISSRRKVISNMFNTVNKVLGR
jgi:hypothetical protein